MNKSLTEQLIRNGYDPELLWKISKEFTEEIIKVQPLPENKQPKTYVLLGCMAAVCKFLSEISREQLNKFIEDKTIESTCNNSKKRKTI